MKALHPYLETKKHIIWDWNGTLLRDIEHAVRTTNRLLKEENLPPMNVDRYKQIFRFPVIDYYRDLGFDTSPEKFLEICERFNRYFLEGVEACGLWPGADQTLAHVKKSGKVQSILSASEQTVLNQQVKLFVLEHYFDHVAGLPDKSAGSKVDQGHRLMEKVGIPAQHTLMIGDTDHDLEVAKALGIDIILVEHGHQCEKHLRRIHHTVLKIF
jgi:phosphoglycolate phosphatase